MIEIPSLLAALILLITSFGSAAFAILLTSAGRDTRTYWEGRDDGRKIGYKAGYADGYRDADMDNGFHSPIERATKRRSVVDSRCDAR